MEIRNPHVYHVLSQLLDGYDVVCSKDYWDWLVEQGLVEQLGEYKVTKKAREVFDEAPELIVQHDERRGNRRAEVWVKGDWIESATASQGTSMHVPGVWERPELNYGSRGASMEIGEVAARARAILRACEIAEGWEADAGKRAPGYEES